MTDTSTSTAHLAALACASLVDGDTSLQLDIELFEREISAGRVPSKIEANFSVWEVSLTAPGKRGASPKGTAHAYRQCLASETLAPAPMQALYELVTCFAAQGLCDMPEALPAWADPEALAIAATDAAAKRKAAAAKAKATREANKAAKVALNPATDTKGASQAPENAGHDVVGAANLLIAALGSDMDCLTEAIGLKLYQTLAARYAGRELEKALTEVSLH